MAMKFLSTVSIIAVLVLSTGCIAGKTGGMRETTVSKIDNRGMLTEQTVITESIGTGKYADYSRTVPEVVRVISDADIARTQAIVAMSQPAPGESPDVAPYKGAMAMLALTQTQADYAAALRAIHYGEDGYTLGGKALDLAGGVLRMGVMTYGVTKVVDKVVDGAGDKVSVTGDGNDVSFEKTSATSSVSASAWGEGSPATAESHPAVSGPSTSHVTHEAPLPFEDSEVEGFDEEFGDEETFEEFDDAEVEVE